MATSIRRLSLASLVALAGASALAYAVPARGSNLLIVPTFDNTITSDPNHAAIEATINTDIATLDSYIANPVTITITFGEMSSGLGQSSTYVGSESYSSYLSDLETKQTLSSQDTTALKSLGLSAPYTAANPTANPVNGTTTIATTVPLLIGLGHTETLADGATDSTIQFNSTIVNDSRSGTQVSGNYDLQSVVAHEMDEVLGVGGAGSQLNSGTVTGPVGPLDLFRYSGANARSFTTSNAAISYFSIDGGKTDLVHFNQNGSADNSDFGDWGNGVSLGSGNTPAQVQDAYGGPNDEPNLGANELGVTGVARHLPASRTAFSA